jgi:formate-dependent nitrite reductase membrane component NrfD
MQACPYDAIHIDPDSGTAQKCNYCAHRVEVGLEPPCVNVCPTHAIISGDIDDRQSEISRLLAIHPVQVRKPEKGTEPRLFYIEGDEASLSPGATSVGESYLWSDPPPQGVDLEAWRLAIERHSQEQTAYEVKHEGAKKVYAAPEPHRGSWGRSVSGYVFTKSIASGTMLIMAPLLAFNPRVAVSSVVPATLTALVFLALTCFLLVYKLERRDRFLWVLTRPQWKSWLSRGAYIMTAYAVVLVLILLVHITADRVPGPLIGIAALGAAGTAGYTAFLFNQAKGRDLWQSPVLPLHLLVHAVVAGAGALAFLSLFSASLGPLRPALLRILAGGLAINVLALGAELLSLHPTKDSQPAPTLIHTGDYRYHFWVGVFLLGNLTAITFLALGLLVPGAMLALFGLFVFEDIFVRAGQAISLA